MDIFFSAHISVYMLIAVDFFDFLLILRGDYSYENKITCYFITAGRSSTGAWLWKQMHVLFCNFSRYQDSQSKRHKKDIKRSIKIIFISYLENCHATDFSWFLLQSLWNCCSYFIVTFKFLFASVLQFYLAFSISLCQLTRHHSSRRHVFASFLTIYPFSVS